MTVETRFTAATWAALHSAATAATFASHTVVGGRFDARQFVETTTGRTSIRERTTCLGVLSCSTSVSNLSLSPSEEAYLSVRRDFCPGDEVLREEETPPLESRRALASGLRQQRLVEGRSSRSVSESWRAWRCVGQCGVVDGFEYATRRANRRVQAAFTADGMNEADLLARVSCKVPAGESSMCTRRECPADDTSVKCRALWTQGPTIAM